jgi:RNA polymerase sigma-70 factor (ECF subfamily)
MEKWDTPQQAMAYQHSEAAFERIFKTHFKALHCYAFTFVKDRAAAEDLVQATFCRLWEKSGDLEIHHSVTAYLYRAVYHECLNYLKHRKVEAVHEQHSKHFAERHTENALERTGLRELEGRLASALAELPEGCRTVFQMSRFESLKYREIADQLGISVKTVENQMGKALRVLRLKLADFLPLLMIFLLLKH